MYIAVDFPLDRLKGSTLADYVNEYGSKYFTLSGWATLEKLSAKNENGLAPLNDRSYSILLVLLTNNENWPDTEADMYKYFVEYIG